MRTILSKFLLAIVVALPLTGALPTLAFADTCSGTSFGSCGDTGSCVNHAASIDDPAQYRCDTAVCIPGCGAGEFCKSTGGIRYNASGEFSSVTGECFNSVSQTASPHVDPAAVDPIVSGSASSNGGANAENTSGGFKNPLKAGSLPELLTAVLHGVVQIGSILLVLALVYVGFLFVAAQGAEEKIRDARNALFWTVVGGLILLGAEAISQVISATVEAL